MPRDDAQRVHVETAQEWRDWLAAHHERSDGVWLVTWRPGAGRPAPEYEEQVLEAIAHGWVDSTRKVIDGERTMTWFAPRRHGSTWVRSNKDRVARLEAEDRMTPAGRAKVDEAKASGAWTLLDDAEAGVVPADLATALAADPVASTTWDGLTPGVRKATLVQVALARRRATREQRIASIVAACARGEKPA